MTDQGHIMLKPEAIRLVQQGEVENLLERITGPLYEAGLTLGTWHFLTLTPYEVNAIYSLEVARKTLPTSRLESLMIWPTGHLLIQGNNCRIISTILKGRVSCRGGRTCYVNLIPPQQHIILPKIIEDCPPSELEKKSWDYGCGVRRELSNLGALTVEPGPVEDTTWNALHTATTKDTYVDWWAQQLLTMSSERLFTLERLPEIPDLRL